MKRFANMAKQLKFQLKTDIWLTQPSYKCWFPTSVLDVLRNKLDTKGHRNVVIVVLRIRPPVLPSVPEGPLQEVFSLVKKEDWHPTGQRSPIKSIITTLMILSLKLKQKLLNFSNLQLPNLLVICKHLAVEYAQTLLTNALRCGPVHDKKGLKDTFIEGLKQSVRQSILRCWAAKKSASLQELAHHALFLPIRRRAAPHQNQDSQDPNWQTHPNETAATQWMPSHPQYLGALSTALTKKCIRVSNQ